MDFFFLHEATNASRVEKKFTNLKNVSVDSSKYNSISVLKLTCDDGFNEKKLDPRSQELLDKLYKEANLNNFKIFIN